MMDEATQAKYEEKVKSIMALAKKKKNAASGMNNETMNLISGLTVLRFTSMLGMRNVYFTKEELLDYPMGARIYRLCKKLKLMK